MGDLRLFICSESKGTGKAEFSKEEENNDSSEQVIESFSIPEQLDQRYLQVAFHLNMRITYQSPSCVLVS